MELEAVFRRMPSNGGIGTDLLKAVIEVDENGNMRLVRVVDWKNQKPQLVAGDPPPEIVDQPLEEAMSQVARWLRSQSKNDHVVFSVIKNDFQLGDRQPILHGESGEEGEIHLDKLSQGIAL